MYASHCPQLDNVAENVISCFAGGRWIYDFLPLVHYHRAAYNSLHHPDVQVVSWWWYTYIEMPSTDVLNFHQELEELVIHMTQPTSVHLSDPNFGVLQCALTSKQPRIKVSLQKAWQYCGRVAGKFIPGFDHAPHIRPYT